MSDGLPKGVSSGTPQRWRPRLLGLLILSLALFLLGAGAVLAHIPRLEERGATLETATRVEEPAVSWVYYGTIEWPGETWYYALPFRAGERIYLQLIVPAEEEVIPGLALLGPGLSPAGELPDGMQAPPEHGAVVLAGKAGEAEIEPFTPGAYRYPATLDIRAPEDGTYYAAVFTSERAGPFGLAVGYEESYTVPAWIRLPADLLRIYAWSDGWPLALLPGVLVLLLAAAVVGWRQRARNTRLTPSGWSALGAGILFLTTSAAVLVQLLRALAAAGLSPAAGVSAGFVVAPALLGALLIWLGWRTGEGETGARGGSWSGWGSRIAFFFLGLAGLALLAGYFLGPAFAVLAAILPPYRRRVPASV